MGAQVLGIGDQPETLLPQVAREGLDAYLRVSRLWDTQTVAQAIRQWQVPGQLHRIECLWEPGMMLAAALREAFGLPGMDVAQTTLYRDKEKMKLALDRAGVRTPRHRMADTLDQCRKAARDIGFPVIIKPIAGAGSADTYKIEDEAALEAVLPKLRAVAEMSVEEFIEGKEYTFDTICAGGEILYYNIAWYRPNVLVARSEEWISPQTITLRDESLFEWKKGLSLGKEVIKALDFQTGFTHMEWFLKPNGEAVFGEIGARPPGGRSVELMNYSCDRDVFNDWAEAVIHGKCSQPLTRKYNAAVVFKRAHGQGRIRKIHGLEPLLKRFGDCIVCNNLSPLGAKRRDWKQTLVSDGYLILRHPNLETVMHMADDVGRELQLYASPD